MMSVMMMRWRLSLLLLLLDLTTANDDTLLQRRVVFSNRLILNNTYNVHSLDHFSKHNMLPIKMRTRNSGDEELRSVGVGTSICHAQQTSTCMIVRKGFIVELPTINTFTTSSILQLRLRVQCKQIS